MRGPGLRIQCDVRRLWECPRCHYQRRAPATETVVRCHCIKEEPCMRLVEGVRRVRPEPQPLDHFLEFDPAELADLPTSRVTPPAPVHEPAEPTPETAVSPAAASAPAIAPSDRMPAGENPASSLETAAEPQATVGNTAAPAPPPEAEPPRKPKRKRNRRRGRKGAGAATGQSAAEDSTSGDLSEGSGDDADDDTADGSDTAAED